jgi:hypothetical protein
MQSLTQHSLSLLIYFLQKQIYYEEPPDDSWGCLKVENEVHFLFECNSYSTLRDDFTKSISSIVPNYLKLNNDQKLIYMS